MRTWHLTVSAVVLAVGMFAVTTTAQRGPESRDMTLLGTNDLQARSAYQPVIQKQGNRYIAYIGHHGGEMPNLLTGQLEPNGTSIVDVTNIRQPKYLAHIPGLKDASNVNNGGAQMVRVCSGADLPKADKNKFYLLRTFGTTGHEIWDVTDPAKPSKVTTIVSGLKDTHKSWWECDTGIAYLVSGDPKWRVDRMTKIYDLSDPAHPVFIRDYGLPGQQPGSTVMPVPTDLHGPISIPKSNRVYFGYGTGRYGVVQIVDRKKLLEGAKEPTDANLRYPVIGQLDLPIDVGAHTAFPVLHMMLPEFAKQNWQPVNTNTAQATHGAGEGFAPPTNQGMRDFIFTVGETTANECLEPRQLVRVIDATFEKNMMGISSWTVPEASGNFCARGGRFGTHSTNENMTPIYYGRVLFVAYFNAGVRALDIRDPFNPKEIAYYIPPVTAKTDKRCVGRGADERCKIAIQTNNVEVDDRGYIYIVDRANTGLHILELSGAARRVANFPSNATN
ncbi:MAG TPA: hypothetical protein VL693_03095 [Vicinamibacterales bacterium]|jgi:hypothetical protein|nr:hypothetical protein [Vicinamibacterales bacterium]